MRLIIDVEGNKEGTNKVINMIKDYVAKLGTDFDTPVHFISERKSEKRSDKK